MKRWEQEKARYPAKVSRKLDGVYAEATADGVRTKSGKPLDVPKVSRRLKRHFRKNPGASLKGELYRKGAGLEKIAGEARSGGKSARRLKLHVHPGQGKTPLPIGAVRRVGEKTARDGGKVQRLLGKEVKRGGEGVVVRGPDGVRRKLKPRHDEEHDVVGASSGKRGVVTLKGGQKVQARPGVAAKVGDRMTVSHSGKTRKGRLRSAVAERVRNDQDFAMKFDTPAMKILGAEHPYVRVQEFRASDEEETRQDRKSLGKLAVKAAVGAGVVGTVLYRGRGAKRIRKILPPKVKAGKAAKVRKPRALTKGERKKKAWENAQRKTSKVKGRETPVERQMTADRLRKKRGWGAVEKPLGKGVTKVKPEVRTKADKLLKDGRNATAKMPTDKKGKGILSPREQGKLTRETRRSAREKLGKLRERHRFAMKDERRNEKRDGLSKARDVAIVGAGVGVASAAGAGVRAAKTVTGAVKDAQYRVGKAAREAKRTVTPESVAKAGGKLAKKKVKETAKKYFPTFTKAGGKLVRGLRKTVFQTPASRMCPGLMEFVNAREQLRNTKTDAFSSPLRVASGVEEAYRVNAKGQRIVEELPVGNAQVVRAAYRKAGQVNKWAGRGGGLAKDAKDVVKGTPRQRDAAGRKKKREWEKSWFKNASQKALIGGGILAYAGGMRKSPKFRAANIRAAHKVRDKVNKYLPDAFPGRDFETPAQAMGLIELDAQASGEGWDVRDARGKSARVFAPGSKGRVRREKKWHEKAENERKLWKGGVAGAAVAGMVAGVAGKRALKTGATVRRVVGRIKKGGGFGLGKVKPAATGKPVKLRRPRRKGPHPEVMSRTAAQRKKKVIEFPGQTA